MKLKASNKSFTKLNALHDFLSEFKSSERKYFSLIILSLKNTSK